MGSIGKTKKNKKKKKKKKKKKAPTQQTKQPNSLAAAHGHAAGRGRGCLCMVRVTDAQRAREFWTAGSARAAGRHVEMVSREAAMEGTITAQRATEITGNRA